MLAIQGIPAGQPATVGEIAERLQIQHHSAGELVDRLAQRGLIVRSRADQDRRQVTVSLTAQGTAVLGELTRHHLAELRSAGPRLVAALGALIGDGAGSAERWGT